MQTNDDWLNDYIKTKYPALPPQCPQVPPKPSFLIEDIKASSALVGIYIYFPWSIAFEYKIYILLVL